MSTVGADKVVMVTPEAASRGYCLVGSLCMGVGLNGGIWFHIEATYMCVVDNTKICEGVCFSVLVGNVSLDGGFIQIFSRGEADQCCRDVRSWIPTVPRPIRGCIMQVMREERLLGGVKRLRLMVRCLVEGSSKLDVSAKARRLWYSTQIEAHPSSKLSGSSQIIAAAVLQLLQLMKGREVMFKAVEFRNGCMKDKQGIVPSRCAVQVIKKGCGFCMCWVKGLEDSFKFLEGPMCRVV
eukprot:1137697-Pelagomonas_calceolata.AAC.1